MRKVMFALFAFVLLSSTVALAQQPPSGGATAIATLRDVAPAPAATATSTASVEETGSPAPASGPATTDEASAATADATGEAAPANSTPTDASGDVASTGDAGEEPEPTVGDIAKGAGEVYDIWKTQGWIAGLAALIYLLVQVTKFGFIKSLLGVRKWLRPLIAFVLGLAGAVIANLAGGVVWWNALLGGIAAGLAGPGFNELMNSVTPSGRAKRSG